MKTNWQLERNFIVRPDGQRRWDYVYQYLLQWAMESTADQPSASNRPQEEQYANRHLCPRLDPEATKQSDH